MTPSQPVISLKCTRNTLNKTIEAQDGGYVSSYDVNRT